MLNSGFSFSQKFWPGARDVDDCWVVASIRSVHACASWYRLVGVPFFRTAANKPDDPTQPNPGGIADMALGISKVFPAIASLIRPTTTMTFAEWAALVKQGHVSATIVNSAKLPANYGFNGIHAVTFAYERSAMYNGNEGWLIDNPLMQPHTPPAAITEASVKAAVLGYQPTVHAVIMPTDEQAFTTHPLYAKAIAANETKWENWVATHP